MSLFRSTLILPALLLAGAACAQTWTGSLDSGGVVQIDPNTNRATVYSDNGSTQLWDGTHELQDGSVIIIEDGVVISGGDQSAGAWDTPATPLPANPEAPTLETEAARPSSPCVNLAIKVCGFNGECADNQACSPARQLIQLERDEAWQRRGAGPNQTTAECRKGLSDEKIFPRCASKKAPNTPTACQQLVSHVCGAQGECSESPSCSPAQQLLTMENREREASREADRITYTTKKCSEALGKSDFFKSCLETDAQPQDTPAIEEPKVTKKEAPRFRPFRGPVRR